MLLQMGPLLHLGPVVTLVPCTGYLEEGLLWQAGLNIDLYPLFSRLRPQNSTHTLIPTVTQANGHTDNNYIDLIILIYIALFSYSFVALYNDLVNVEPKS